MESYHASATPSVAPRAKLLPFQYIASPPPTEVFKVILEHCGVGGTFAPGVRQLSLWSGVSRGLITDCLRQIAEKGWILYDGRNITLLRHPDEDDASDRSGDRSHCDESEEVIDQVIDQATATPARDRSGDRSRAASPILAAVQRVALRQNGHGPSDRSPDRSGLTDSDPPLDPPMVHDYLTATSPVVVERVSTTGGSGGSLRDDRSIDRSHPAAQIMAELGADGAIIADAFLARPGWTPQQVRDRWAYDQRRIALSDGHLTEGVFFHALRCGQLAPAREGPQLDPAAYANRDGFTLGSAVPPEVESIRDHAARLLPAPTAATHRQYITDWLFVQDRLGQGDSDDEALAALATHRQRSRGGP